jgi:hypothetical protein
MKTRTALGLIMSAVWPLLALGCERATGPRASVNLDLTGRYVGWWTVEATDTVSSCGGIGGGGCIPIRLEVVSCQAVTDIGMEDERHFSGSFRLQPPTSDPRYADAHCNLGVEKWLTLATSGEIRNGRVDSVSGDPGRATGIIRFTVGDSSTSELERLLGCTYLGERQFAWRMSGRAGDPEVLYGPGTPARFDARPTIALAGAMPRFECRGRRMNLHLTFEGER